MSAKARKINGDRAVSILRATDIRGLIAVRQSPRAGGMLPGYSYDIAGVSGFADQRYTGAGHRRRWLT
jgi:hypothetical protein